ncbi:phosphatidate cytidylyltransferase [Granulosicoccus sp. 3-233]|uniref:phosphatidate cytidylyltransferase n=1 Tax=Granulosicoccus sp. 3-233 TaxID=3417969 RepID=UPI003D3585BF
MLKTRVLTAVVLLLVFSAGLILTSVDVFALGLGFVVAAGAWEWGRMSGLVNEDAQTAYAVLVGVVSLIALYLPYSEAWIQWLMLVGVLFWLSVPALFYLSPRQPPIVAMDRILLAIGLLVFVVAAVAIQYLRSFAPQGSSWLLLYALCIVWTMDIGAYFSGRRFGHRKLAPSISPGKTWEGVYGGLAATVVLMLIVMLVADFADGNRFKLLVATLLAAMISVLGDLYESRIKRAAALKDSSQLLPGHGGVLDRLDGVVAALPVFAFIWVWL